MIPNHFELFGLPVAFDVDDAALDRAYREVQGRVHPDRHAAGTDADKRAALQWATLANEGYRTLKSPLARAKYLCELNGRDLQAESNTAMPPDFLMQQMEWREALDEARACDDPQPLEQLERQLRDERALTIEGLRGEFAAGDLDAAVSRTRKLMFVERLGEEIAESFERLDAR